MSVSSRRSRDFDSLILSMLPRASRAAGFMALLAASTAAADARSVQSARRVAPAVLQQAALATAAMPQAASAAATALGGSFGSPFGGPFGGAPITPATVTTVTSALGTDPIVFNNTAPTGAHVDISDGSIVFDEGRIPSSSAPQAAAQDSYSITSFEIAYRTRAQNVANGGPGAHVRIAFYAKGSVGASPASLPAPTATFDLTGLPASSSLGSQSLHVVTVTPTTPICFRADGDGKFDVGAGNEFVWAFMMPDETLGSAGPVVAGDPNNCRRGDGTYFQATGSCATGLGAVDGFGRLTPSGAYSYQDLGGYPAAPFGSFHLLVRAPLSGDCVGCGIADPFFEDNDSCATATPMPIGLNTGLIAEAGDDDFYRVSVPPNHVLRATARFDGAIADLDLEILETTCGAPLAGSYDVGSDEVLSNFHCGEASNEYIVRVISDPVACANYDLFLEVEPVVDDAFEDNDTCAQSQLAGVSTFTTRGLVVSECDPDYYILQVIQQREVQVELLFDNDESNIDVRIFDPSCSQLLASSTTTNDRESARYFNASGPWTSVIVEVTCSGGQGFATYDFAACYSLGDVISFTACAGETNSTGLPATMCARGSDIATDNLVLFYAVDLPSQVFGYFITSEETDYRPNAGGGRGTLCLGASGIGRYANDVLLTNNNNAAFYQPDLTATPRSSSADISVVAGDTRYWQFWYRDNDGMGGATSNFTGAVGVVFQ